MTKRLYFSSLFDRNTLGSKPTRFVGFTGDGHVGFTAAGIELINAIEIPHEAASELATELLYASGDAKRMADEAAGLNQWVARPTAGAGARFEVQYHGHTGIFRPILNSKRRPERYADPSQAPKGHRCTVCRKESPEGATMYVFDERTRKPGVYDPVASTFRHSRACEGCMRPELAAALLGAALVAAGKATP